MEIEPEAREYLDGEWTARTCLSLRVIIDGPDGNSLLTCDSWGVAHFLTPEAVAAYLLEQHGAAERLAAREQDIERALVYLETPAGDDPGHIRMVYVRRAIEALEKSEAANG